MKIRFGFTLGAVPDPEVLMEVVDHLERLRFDSLWIPETLARPTLDPIVALSMAAVATTRLKIGSHLILPGRHPFQLARQLAHLDRLSGGRLLLMGVLGLPDEADAGLQGVARGQRPAALEEMVPLLHRLWAGETVDHAGEFSAFGPSTLDVLPVQQPLELWLGGQAPAALDRCGRLGDGWMPGFVAPEAAAEMRLAVEAAADRAGRKMDPEHFGANLPYARTADAVVRPGTPVGWAELRSLVERWLAAGFSKFLLSPAEPPRAWGDELEELAAEILPLTT